MDWKWVQCDSCPGGGAYGFWANPPLEGCENTVCVVTMRTDGFWQWEARDFSKSYAAFSSLSDAEESPYLTADDAKRSVKRYVIAHPPV